MNKVQKDTKSSFHEDDRVKIKEATLENIRPQKTISHLITILKDRDNDYLTRTYAALTL